MPDADERGATPKPDPKCPNEASEWEPDKRERLLKSDLDFEELTRTILNKKPPAGGWKTEREGRMSASNEWTE